MIDDEKEYRELDLDPQAKVDARRAAEDHISCRISMSPLTIYMLLNKYVTADNIAAKDMSPLRIGALTIYITIYASESICHR